ncbi:trigger factor [Hominifimenecus microfluidus]|uniref:trigger factor n=1 Tax=Hominifimenecus microfluidus TaxID=2885348 RepID=UPI00302BC6FC
MSEQRRTGIILGEYKGLQVPGFDRTITDEDVMESLRRLQAQNVYHQEVEGRPVQNGDIATIDYEGFYKGKPFQGGKGSEYPLEIGSGSFIPGFEEQIVGHMPGEEFDIEVMFPEQYHSADLAGKPAVFRIYLHKTEEKIVPELNDAFAAAVSEYNTLAEYKEYLRELEVQRREQAAKNAAMEQALQKAIANAQMEEYAATEEYEALVRDAEDQLIGRFEQDLQAQGITMDQYLSMTQETMEGLHRQVHPSAEQKVQAELVLEAVAETEGLDVTEEEVEVAVAQLAAQYQVNLAAMKNALDMDALRQNLRINKAASLIADSAVEIF